MKDIDSMPQDPPPLDQEKEKLKEKIKEILDFPIYVIVMRKDLDTDPKRFLESNPSSEEVDRFIEETHVLKKISSGQIAQLCFVIIGEQPAFNGVFIFDDKDHLDAFQNLVTETGVLFEIVETKDVLGKLQARINFAKSEDNLRKIKEVVSARPLDSKKFDEQYGKLMGFPDTAVAAYVRKAERLYDSREKNPDEKYPQYKRNKKSYGRFGYSKEHADEEHAYFLERNRKLMDYAPQLFSEE